MRLAPTVVVLIAALSLTAVTARAQTGGPATVVYQQPPRSTAAWTSATAPNTAVTLNAVGYAEAIVTVTNVAPISGQIIFEGDDSSATYAWPISGQRLDVTGALEQQPVLMEPNVAWTVPVAGFASFRVRLVGGLSGSGSVSIAVSLTAATSAEPNATALIAAMQSVTTQLRALQGQRGGKILGTFGRSISSTGDALDVNVRYPPASFDPCAGTKSNAAISQAASAVLLAKAAGRVTICALLVVGADAENVSLVEGTGTTCGTGTTAVIGGSTAANGPNLAAGGGFSLGNGTGTIAVTATPGNDLCLLQSGVGRVAGNLTYVVR